MQKINKYDIEAVGQFSSVSNTISPSVTHREKFSFSHICSVTHQIKHRTHKSYNNIDYMYFFCSNSSFCRYILDIPRDKFAYVLVSSLVTFWLFSNIFLALIFMFRLKCIPSECDITKISMLRRQYFIIRCVRSMYVWSDGIFCKTAVHHKTDRTEKSKKKIFRQWFFDHIFSPLDIHTINMRFDFWNINETAATKMLSSRLKKNKKKKHGLLRTELWK